MYTAYIVPRKVYSVNIERAPRPARAARRSQAYHHGNLRQALVQAALEHLERSPAELSLRQLARSVGVTVNAAYRHFADKDAVLAAVAAAGFRRFSAEQRSAGAGFADADDALLALGRAYVQFAQDHPALFRLMFGRPQPSRAPPAELEEASREAFQGLLGVVAAALRLPSDDRRALTAAVHAWALVHGLSHLLLERQLENFACGADELIAAVLSDARAQRGPQASPRRGRRRPSAP